MRMPGPQQRSDAENCGNRDGERISDAKKHLVDMIARGLDPARDPEHRMTESEFLTENTALVWALYCQSGSRRRPWLLILVIVHCTFSIIVSWLVGWFVSWLVGWFLVGFWLVGLLSIVGCSQFVGW